MKLLEELTEDPYLYFSKDEGLLSVYDDNNYLPNDVDFMGPGMRNYIIDKLRKFSFEFDTGRVLKSKLYEYEFIFPRMPLLGYSPLTLMSEVEISQNQIYILTPTQLAGHYLYSMSYSDAKEKIIELMQEQPINLNRLLKSAKRKNLISEFQKDFEWLQKEQERIIKQGPLRNKRHLESIL